MRSGWKSTKNKTHKNKTTLSFGNVVFLFYLCLMKLIHDKGNSRVVLEDDSKNAFYTDELVGDAYASDETVDTVVTMFNEGKSLIEIDEFLLDDIGCTQEAREIITEGLYKIYYSDEC